MLYFYKMPNDSHIFDKHLIKKIELRSERAENVFYERFNGMEKKLIAPDDIRKQIYVATISDIIMYIRRGKGDKIENLRNYTWKVLSNKHKRWQKNIMNDKGTVIFVDHELIHDEKFDDSVLNVEQKEQMIELVESILSGLSDQCRKIIAAKYTKKLRFEEIAKELKYSSANSARGAHHTCINQARKLGGDQLDKIFE